MLEKDPQNRFTVDEALSQDVLIGNFMDEGSGFLSTKLKLRLPLKSQKPVLKNDLDNEQNQLFYSRINSVYLKSAFYRFEISKSRNTLSMLSEGTWRQGDVTFVRKRPMNTTNKDSSNGSRMLTKESTVRLNRGHFLF